MEGGEAPIDSASVVLTVVPSSIREESTMVVEFDAFGRWVAVNPDIPPPPIEAHPVALPLAKIPVGAWPVVQREGFAASAVAVAALPVVLWFRVGMSAANGV